MNVLHAVATGRRGRSASAPAAALPLVLVLEPQMAAHALALFPVLSDPAIVRHDGVPPASVAWLLQRFSALESRCSGDGRQQWLNWVVRTDARPPAFSGTVQATLDGSGDALIGYEFGSAWWGRGLAFAAVGAMLDELVAHHGAKRAVAVTHRGNQRSNNLLHRLMFEPIACWPDLAASDGEAAADECCWVRCLGGAPLRQPA